MSAREMAEEGLPVNILGGQFEQDVVPFGSTISNAELENYLKVHAGEFNLSDYGGFGEIEEAVNKCNALYANDTLDLKKRFPDDGDFCETVFDSISCWPPTQLNDTAVVRCFSELNGIRYNDTHNATRLCFENGTWSKSNYLSCEEIMDPRSHDVITTTTIYIIGYSLSLVALAVAIYIFLSFKDLKCLRNTIHTNLMCAYGFVYTLWILTLIFELNFESHIACVILIILLHYFHLTTFFWMFVEGLYLYILVVETLTRENFKLRVYSFIGWVLPIFFVIIWAVVKSFLPVTDDSSSTLAEDVGAVNLWTHCPWMRPHWVDWIHQSPTVLVLLLNLVFLASIMWVLITKLRSANTLETQQYRKAAKALLVLMPLLGITYVLTIAGPTSGDSSKMIFDYARAVLLSTQGFTVALFYCFLNTEVQNTVKHHFDTWRTSRSLGQNHLRTGSRSKDWSPRSRTESIRLYSQPTYHKRESCTSEVTTTTLVTVNGGGRSSSNGGVPTVRSPFLHPPRPSYPGNV